MTKVEAIKRVMERNNGRATWSEIYQKIGRYYKGAKVSTEWQAGIRGVLYRELRNNRTFYKIGDAAFGLKEYENKKCGHSLWAWTKNGCIDCHKGEHLK